MSEELKSKGFKRAELNIQKRLRNIFLTNYAHYTVPGINSVRDNSHFSWDADSVIQTFQDYPYYCDLPKPLLPPIKLERGILAEEDPALQLITTKSYMKDDINRITEYYKKHKNVFKLPKKKDVQWVKDNGNKSTSLPRYVAEIAEIIELDPDPYFSGKYNWYYSGGTLNNIYYGGENILLFPYSEELIATPISSIQRSLWKPRLQQAAKYDLSGVLYELRHKVENDSCRILGRYKNHCILYGLFGINDQMQIVKLYKQASRVPFVSADINPFNFNEYSTSNVDRLITKWDLVKAKSVSRGKIINTKSLDDNWGSIRYQTTDPEVLVYVDRCCIHYIDTREPIERPALSLCPKRHLEVCESLCLDHPSTNSFYRYVGSYHNFILCDKRSPDQCTQQKWTHQFKSAPLLSSVINKGDQEMILLMSQLPRESSIIVNNWIDDNSSRSYSFPYTPKNILETLKQSRMQGKCLNPYMKLRLELCNVGCTLITDDKGLTFIFQQNSIGDIFYQGITHEKAQEKFVVENSKAISTLEAWENAILKQRETVMPLAISEKSDMSHIYKNLSRTKLKLVLPDKSEQLYNPLWQQPLTLLSSYKDILAPELLQIWEVINDSVLSLIAVPHQKVLNWLQTSTTTEPSIPSTSQIQDIESIPSPIITQGLIVPEQPDVEFIDLPADIHQVYLPKIKSEEKSKEIKKRKYVPGF